MPAAAVPIRALLFDLDGTITDTDAQHFAATKMALKSFGLTIDRQTYLDVVYGAPNEAIAEHFFPGGDAADQSRYVKAKEQAYRGLLAELEPTPGLSKVFQWADRHGIGLALVSNAPRLNMECVLGGLGMLDRFDTVVLAEDLPVGKPDPLPYVTALRSLGVSAEQALGFEDSEPGVQALGRAGVFAIGVATGLTADALLAAGADHSIPDFEAPVLWEILATRTPDGPVRM